MGEERPQSLTVDCGPPHLLRDGGVFLISRCPLSFFGNLGTQLQAGFSPMGTLGTASRADSSVPGLTADASLCTLQQTGGTHHP